MLLPWWLVLWCALVSLGSGDPAGLIRQSSVGIGNDESLESGNANAGDQDDDSDSSFQLFNSSGTSLDSQYQATHKLLHPTSTLREFRRGLALLEECSKHSSRSRISADALADLAYLHLFGSHGKNALTVHPTRAFQYANQSAHQGSPRGRHLLAFLLRLGLGLPSDVPPGGSDTASASWKLELLAAEQNYLPAMMSVAHNYFYTLHDCDAALRLYRAAATAAVRQVEATFYGDYASLRPLQPERDEIGDDLVARAARDAETIDYWMFHAERKDNRALFEMGKMYQLGLWGTPRNMPRAVDFYRRAAAAGHVGAQGELGRLLTIGHGCDLNLGFALKYLRQATALQETSDLSSTSSSAAAASSSAEDASPVAQEIHGPSSAHPAAVAAATLGSLLNRRIFESEDADMALRYLRQAASAGSTEAEWELGQVELLDGRLDAALQHFQRAERAGHVRSMLALAQLYETRESKGNAGKFGASSICKVVTKLYKRVAEVGPWLDAPYGPRQALRELRAGRESEALLMYLLAAGEGHEIPHYNAAWMLTRSKGMSSGSATLSAAALNKKQRRYSTALQLLQTLHVMNPAHPWASLVEGDLHYRGHGTARDVAAAACCYERSAAAGNVFGMERLAVLLINGAGVRQDDQRAQQLIRHALARCSQESSGLKGLAVLVKQTELTYRLALMSFTGVVRAVLSGKWIQTLMDAIFGKRRKTAAETPPPQVSEEGHLEALLDSQESQEQQELPGPAARFSSQDSDQTQSPPPALPRSVFSRLFSSAREDESGQGR